MVSTESLGVLVEEVRHSATDLGEVQTSCDYVSKISGRSY
jgi:hypothetical protein